MLWKTLYVPRKTVTSPSTLKAQFWPDYHRRLRIDSKGISSGSKPYRILMLNSALLKIAKESLTTLKVFSNAPNVNSNSVRSVFYLGIKGLATWISRNVSKTGRGVRIVTFLLKKLKVATIWYANADTNSAMYVKAPGVTSIITASQKLRTIVRVEREEI